MQDATTPVVSATPVNRFLVAKMKKKHIFMGQDTFIFKLSVAQARKIQEVPQGFSNPSAPTESESLAILDAVIREGCPDLADIEDFEVFPIDELAKLSSEIMIFSGLQEAAGGPGKK